MIKLCIERINDSIMRSTTIDKNASRFPDYLARYNNKYYISKKNKDNKYEWTLIPDNLTNYFDINKFIYGEDTINNACKYDCDDFLNKYNKVKDALENNNIYIIYINNQGENVYKKSLYNCLRGDLEKYVTEKLNKDINNISIIFTSDERLFYGCIKDGFIILPYHIKKEDNEIILLTIRNIFHKSNVKIDRKSKQIFINMQLLNKKSNKDNSLKLKLIRSKFILKNNISKNYKKKKIKSKHSQHKIKSKHSQHKIKSKHSQHKIKSKKKYK
jgi:hypothetical protein